MLEVVKTSEALGVLEGFEVPRFLEFREEAIVLGSQGDWLAKVQMMTSEAMVWQGIFC